VATRAAAVEGTGGRDSAAVAPYPQSWVDSLVGWFERLPGPTWAAYVIFVGLFTAWVAIEAAFSARGLFNQDPAYFMYGILQAAPLVLYHLLSRGAIAAFEAFRPATDFDDATARRVQLELSTTPAVPAIIVSVLAALAYLALFIAVPEGIDIAGQPPLYVAMRILGEVMFMFTVAFVSLYLLVRQLRLVARLHHSVARVDLLQPAPLHAMARLTARGAIILLAFQLVALLPLPNVADNVRFFITLFFVPFMVVPIAGFFVPLRGMQSLLQREKRRRLAEVSSRIDSTIGSLHLTVDEETGGPRDAEQLRVAQLRIDGLNKALTSLLQERDFLSRLPTWPWDTSTLRAVVSAVAVPILLFVVTTAINRLFF
jgi:hypothetical protein